LYIDFMLRKHRWCHRRLDEGKLRVIGDTLCTICPGQTLQLLFTGLRSREVVLITCRMCWTVEVGLQIFA
jgi:hypothetical protein